MTLFKTEPAGPDNARNIDEVLNRLERVALSELEVCGNPAITECEFHNAAWYAHQINSCCRTIRTQIKAGAAAQAAYTTVLLMQWVEHANIDSWETEIKAGAKFVSSGHDGGRPEQHSTEDIQAHLDELHRQHPSWNITALRDQAVFDLGYSDRRVIERRTLYNPTKK